MLTPCRHICLNTPCSHDPSDVACSLTSIRNLLSSGPIHGPSETTLPAFVSNPDHQSAYSSFGAWRELGCSGVLHISATRFRLVPLLRLFWTYDLQAQPPLGSCDPQLPAADCSICNLPSLEETGSPSLLLQSHTMQSCTQAGVEARAEVHQSNILQ